jgi:DNA-binding beta-propeller fold protein YncE
VERVFRGWSWARAAGLLALLFALGLTFASERAGAALPIPYKYEAALSEKLSDTLGESVPGGFVSPWGLAFDSSGDLFVADPESAGGGVIDKFDATNAFLSPQLGPGEPPVLTGGFTRGVAVNDETGHIYVGDSGSSEVVAMSAGGEGLSRWSGAGTPAGTFGGGCCYVYPAVDDSTSASKGDVYVMTTHEGGEVDVLEPQGEDKEEGKYLRSLEPPLGGFSFGGVNGRDGLAINDSSGPEAGEVYVADTGHKVIDRFSATGEFEEAHQIKGPSSGTEFVEPIAVAVDDATGDVFVIDHVSEFSFVVDKFSASGEPLGQIKETGRGEPFGEIFGIAVQRAGANAGDVYVSDAGKHVVDVFALEVPAKPTIAEPTVTQVSADAANLQAQINPHGATTRYRFEYGPCTTAQTCSSSPFELSAPVPEGKLGSEEDFAGHQVVVHINGLAADTTYHFRIVASNLHGETTVEGRSFATQGIGGELLLPDSREWELVSPPDKHGGKVEAIPERGVVQAAAGGGAISYLANAPTEDEPQGSAGEVQVLSSRGAGGWSSRDLATPHEAATGKPLGTGPEYRFFAEDLSTALVQPFGRFNPKLSPTASEQTPYLRTLGSCESSCYLPLVSGAPGHENVPAGTHFGEERLCEEENGLHKSVAAVCGPLFLAATSDLSHVVLSSAAELTSGAGREQLYEWAGGQLQPISVLPANEAGEELPAAEGTALLGTQFGQSHDNARRALSTDGSRVFWESQGTLYVRDTALQQTLQLDAAEPECLAKGECESGGGQYQIASSDGSRVLFTDRQRLTKDAGAKLGTTGPEPDLYECRLEVRAGKLACGPSGPVDLTPLTGGESANVQGDILGASEDGSAIYFVAQGTLGTGPNARGESAIAGQPNLYVRRDGMTSLIATLAGGDSFDWRDEPSLQPTRVSPGGQWLSFMSERPLTGYDNRDASSGQPDAEIYLYDASAGSLSCASCDPTGARPVGEEYAQVISTANERLVGGRGEWARQSWVAALPPITTEFTILMSAYQSRYLSNEGRLFFNSLDALVPQDVNGNWDVYEHEPENLGSCEAGSSSFSGASAGCTSLISSGSSAQQSAFLDASESGDDVFFLTTAKLTAQDIDASYDVYDAHVCSSASPCIAPPAASPPPCSTEASCKPAPSPQPPIFGAPASATFAGPGNASPPPPAPPLKVKAPTRHELLTKALASCHKRFPKSKARRGSCERQAQRKYGAKKAAAKPKAKAKKSAKKSTKGRGKR